MNINTAWLKSMTLVFEKNCPKSWHTSCFKQGMSLNMYIILIMLYNFVIYNSWFYWDYQYLFCELLNMNKLKYKIGLLI